MAILNPEHMSTRSIPPWVLATLILVTLFGVFVRVVNLADESPWYDEVITLEHLDAPDTATFLARIAPAGTPTMPVYFVMEYWWARLVSDSVTGVRMLSVLFSVLAIPAIFALGRRLFDDRTGLLAAFFLAASLSQVYYGQEIRMYAQIPVFAIGSVYTLFVGLGERRPAFLALNVVFNVLLAWTHAFATLMLIAEALYVMAFTRISPRVVVAWSAAHAAMMFAYLGWVYSQDVPRILEVAEVIAPASVADYIVAASIFAGGRATNENPVDHLPLTVSLDWVLLGAMAALACWACYVLLARIRNADGDAPTRYSKSTLLLLWLFLPPLMLIVLSWAWRPVFVYRYVLYVSIPLYLLAARGVSLLPRRWARTAVGVTLVTLFVYQLSALAVGPFRADWKVASAYVESEQSDSDTYFCYQNVHSRALDYVTKLPEVRNIEVWSEICGSVHAATTDGRIAWLFVVMWSEPSKFESCFNEHGLMYTIREFESWPTLRVYRISEGIHAN